MEILTIINSILLCVIIIFLLIKPYLQKFTITINRTFWEKKSYGFHITKWQYNKDITSNNGKVVFNFNWKKPKYLSDDIEKKERT